MFTIEHDHDETVTTVLDNDGKHEDLQLIIGDKSVYIRQYNPGKKTYDLIEISPFMFQELMKSMEYPEGSYLTTGRFQPDRTTPNGTKIY